MVVAGLQLSTAQAEFLAYWRGQAGGRAPRRTEFDVLDVPTLMQHAVVFDVLDDPLDYRYRLIGTAVRNMSYKDYTGERMSEIDGRGPGSKIWTVLDEVRVRQETACHAVPYIGPKKDFMMLTNLFLPYLGGNGETSMILLVSCFQPR